MALSTALQKSLQRFMAPIGPLITDGAVSEILINGYREIWVERDGVLFRSDCAFPTPSALDAMLVNIAQCCGKDFDQKHPILETRLPDGSRLEAVMPPLAQNGPTVSIRRFSKTRLTINQLVERKTLSAEAAFYLAKAVGRKANLVISGGTGSGKSSLLQAVAGFFDARERIVVLEDTHEIEINRPHVVYLQSRASTVNVAQNVGIRELLRATLRLRPDRIIVGEIRGAEALDMIQAITSGHGGSMTTVHANSPVDALARIETMALMAQEEMPLHALRSQIASAVNFVVQIERSRDGRRRVTEVVAVSRKLKDGNFVFRRIFAEDAQGVLVRRSALAKPQGGST
ncbi:MAG: Flp pilus assembly complex ATPase component TadA [Proteobacteria bacterium]|nr:Flp pilus assembly complex ATPase component TadA [Pseudomonadota bacterium]